MDSFKTSASVPVNRPLKSLLMVELGPSAEEDKSEISERGDKHGRL